MGELAKSSAGSLDERSSRGTTDGEKVRNCGKERWAKKEAGNAGKVAMNNEIKGRKMGRNCMWSQQQIGATFATSTELKASLLLSSGTSEMSCKTVRSA